MRQTLCIIILTFVSHAIQAGDTLSIDYSQSEYMSGWGSILLDQVDEEGARGGTVLRARPQAIGTNFWDWGIQTKGSTRIEVSPGSDYDVSFKLKAASQRGVFFKVVATDIGSGTEVEYFGEWVAPEMSTEWQTYSYKGITITNETASYLQLQWMGANEDPTFYIDDLQVSLDMSKYVPVSGIAIENCPAETLSGKYEMLAAILPDTASNKSLSWSSSNDSVAIVTVGGTVIPRKSGEVDIIVTSNEGGFRDTCHVEVVLLNRTYYVTKQGDNANQGTGSSAGESWLTIAFALEQLLPGDSLYIGDGNYQENDLVLKNLFAYPGKPTVIKAVNPLGAAIETRGKWASVLSVKSCSYVEIDGLEAYISDEQGLGSGISIAAGTDHPMKSHHINIRNCFVHDCGCGGIGTNRAGDYVLIENNIVRDNAKRSEYNCSGISIYHPVQTDTLPGYHIIIRGNVAFENECDLPFTPGGFDTPTDGNGIIVDDLYHSQGDPSEAYSAPVLIENNLSFNNGGRGINLYKADHIMVRNNTLWHNMRILSNYKATGDVNFGDTKDCSFINNIVVVNDSIISRAFGYYSVSSGMPVYNNLFVGGANLGSGFDSRDNHFVSALAQNYPLLNNPTTEVSFSTISDFKAYFGLQAESPAADAGTSFSAPVFDLEGMLRPTCDSIDMGAYEFHSAGNYLPKVAIVSPATGTKFSLGDTIHIEVESSDCDGSLQGLSLYANEVKIMESDQETTLFSVTGLEVGSYSFVAEATDDSGDARSSLTIDIEVMDTATVSVLPRPDHQIRIYPNPASEHLVIEGAAAFQLELYNVKGQLVVNRTLMDQQESIDVNSLPGGPYFLKLRGEKEVLYKKVLVGY